MAEKKRKAHLIQVDRFVKGNQGDIEHVGFIFRHGEVQPAVVPVASGCCTPRLRIREFMIVKISEEHRFMAKPT